MAAHPRVQQLSSARHDTSKFSSSLCVYKELLHSQSYSAFCFFSVWTVLGHVCGRGSTPKHMAFSRDVLKVLEPVSQRAAERERDREIVGGAARSGQELLPFSCMDWTSGSDIAGSG